MRRALVPLAAAALLAVAAAPAPALPTPTTFAGVGGTNTAGGALNARSAFLAAIGGADNGSRIGSASGGVRTVTWDGVPDADAAPNAFPAAYYDVLVPRGLLLHTPGNGFEVSSTAAGQTLFANINPTYAGDFAAFSPSRLLAPIGSNLTEVRFLEPSSPDFALTRGFGAIFSNVRTPNATNVELFSAGGTSLGKFFVPTSASAAQPEFLGILFPSAIVARAEIVTGTAALSAATNDGPPATNVVALDDFAYAEPQPLLSVAAPASGAIVSSAQLTVSGSVLTLDGLQAVSVDGAPVTVAGDGSWSSSVTLQPGVNAIEVEAAQVDGTVSRVTRSVTYAPPAPPVVSVPPAPAVTSAHAKPLLSGVKVAVGRGGRSLTIRATLASRASLVASLSSGGGRASHRAASGRVTLHLALSRTLLKTLRQRHHLSLRLTLTATPPRPAKPAKVTRTVRLRG